MKKTLVAVAVLACAGSAMAQSSVTLYGVADVSVGATRSPALVNPAYPLGAPVSGTSRGVQMHSSTAMNNGISIFGVRGNEDLGGGMRAGFNFEAALSLTDGSTGQDNGTFWGRQAKVTLGGPWGSVEMGRAFTPSFYSMYAWDLTGQAVYSLVDRAYGFGIGQATNQLSPRASSEFMYATPTFNGVTGRIAYVAKDNNPNLLGQPSRKVDGSVVYASGPVVLSLGANQMQGSKTNWAVGGRYSFGQVGGGQFNVAAGYASTYLQAALPLGSNAPTSLTNLARRGFSIAGQYITGPYSLTLNVTRDTRNEIYIAVPSMQRKYTNEMLEGKYALSKRTFLYAVYEHFDSDNNYALGIRHNF
jgi:predicted porin